MVKVLSILIQSKFRCWHDQSFQKQVMKTVRLLCLFFVLTVVLSTRILQANQNLIQNGKFDRFVMALDWQVLNSDQVAPWITKQLETGQANFLNPSWNRQGQVAMIYPGQTNIVKQIVNCQALPYVLTFEWGFSPNFVQRLSATVSWNGIVVKQLLYNDANIHSEQITVPGLVGPNVLSFQAEGTYSFELLHHSVSFGNVTLTPQA